MAALTSIHDNFDDGSRAAIWNDAASGLGVTTETGGTLVCTPPTSNATTSFAGYTTVATYDLTGLVAPGCPLVKIPQIPTSNATMYSLFELVKDANNYIYWFINNGTIGIAKVVAGVQTTLSSTTYNSTTHLWLGFQEVAGATYWINSSDGGAWSIFSGTGYANPFAVTALSVTLEVFSFVSLGSPGALKFDQFNVWPVNGTMAATLPVETLAASGSERINGTSALSEPVVVLAASGSERINGTAAITEPVVTLAASGAETISGTSALTMPVETLAAIGSERINGTAAITEPVVVLAATGSERINGSSALTLPVETLAATGSERINGTSGLTLPVETLAASGSETIGATAALTLPVETLAATGSERINGASAMVLPVWVVRARTPFFHANATTTQRNRWQAVTSLRPQWTANTTHKTNWKARTTLRARVNAITGRG